MKKQLVKKIILSSIIFSLIFPSIFLPFTIEAESKVDWNAPGKYKIQLTDTLDGQMLADVVSCTGIVDGAIKAVTTFASDQLKKLVKKKVLNAARAACKTSKTGTVTALAAAMNFNLTDIPKEIDCAALMNGGIGGVTEVADKSGEDTAKEIAAENKKDQKRKECLNGIATKLAKDQLAVMTKYTMNWVNSGFSGDPMYVRNINSFMGNMTDDILTKELDVFKGAPGYYPYYSGYARNSILGNISIKNFKDSMQQNLTNYLDSGALGENAADLLNNGTSSSYLDRYAKDFSLGGWNGWLALTQREQNNPLGYSMQMSQHIADEQNKEVENTKQELMQNQGMLSQKKCVAYGNSEKKASNNAEKLQAQAVLAQKRGIMTEAQKQQDLACKILTNPECKQASLTFSQAQDDYQTLADAYAKKYNATDGADQGEEFKDCTKWETVTPGSVILSKVNTYLNSEVKQLELADGVNQFLAGVFDSLITVLRNDGLSSLSSMNQAGGTTYNSPILDIDPKTGEVKTSSGYTNKSVDLTKDLGNTFVHDEFINLGDWNAKKNSTKTGAKLFPNIAPIDSTGASVSNAYYTVSVPGNTQLILQGYNGWASGDRAFFNGTEWQNWKKGTPSPIKKAGILQIQKDYIVAAKEMLSILPSVMPAIGELDYCIPGPNQGWQANTGEAENTFMEYVSGLTTNYTPPGGFLGKREYVTIVSPEPESDIYKNYKKIFEGTSISSVWNMVTNSAPFKSIVYAPKINSKWKGKKLGYSRGEMAIALVLDIKDKISRDLDSFKTEYAKTVASLFGPESPMQRQYLEREDTYALTPNPSYLAMSSEGLNITKDIVSYNDKTSELIGQYKSDIIDANTNIKKLELIKDQVSAIIVAAQKRRDENRTKILEDYNKNNNTNITPAQYNECIKEEKVSFYEDTDIFNKFNGGAERCTDGIDNDLDGLIDSKDPDCSGVNICSTVNVDPSCPTDNYDNIPTDTGNTIFTDDTSDETPEVNID